jgi:hypothetical protein
MNNTKLVFPSRSEPIQGALVWSEVILPTQPVVRNYMKQGAIGVVFNASAGSFDSYSLMFSLSLSLLKKKEHLINTNRLDVPGRLMFATDGQDDSDITIPVVQLGPFSVIDTFKNFQGSYMIVSLTSDGNQWRDTYESPVMIVAQVIVTASGLVYAMNLEQL